MKSAPTHGFLYLYIMISQVENTETMLPTAEALYPQKPQAPRSKGLLDDLYEEVAKEYFYFFKKHLVVSKKAVPLQCSNKSNTCLKLQNTIINPYP